MPKQNILNISSCQKSAIEANLDFKRWCALRVSWCALRVSWCALRVSWCALRVSWCALRVSWCALRVSFMKRKFSSMNLEPCEPNILSPIPVKPPLSSSNSSFQASLARGIRFISHDLFST